MSRKREQMIKKARKELQKHEEPKEPSIPIEEKKPPSFIASYFILFAGVSLITFTWGSTYSAAGMFLGIPLVTIGMFRSFKAAASQKKKGL